MQLLTSQKKILGPVHLHPKTDKWDYLRSPIMKKHFISCFDIGEVPRSPGKWNLNWLYFLPFIFTFEQGVIRSTRSTGRLTLWRAHRHRRIAATPPAT